MQKLTIIISSLIALSSLAVQAEVVPHQNVTLTCPDAAFVMKQINQNWQDRGFNFGFSSSVSKSVDAKFAHDLEATLKVGSANKPNEKPYITLSGYVGMEIKHEDIAHFPGFLGLSTPVNDSFIGCKYEISSTNKPIEDLGYVDRVGGQVIFSQRRNILILNTAIANATCLKTDYTTATCDVANDIISSAASN